MPLEIKALPEVEITASSPSSSAARLIAPFPSLTWSEVRIPQPAFEVKGLACASLAAGSALTVGAMASLFDITVR
jgi:hypothetical protein